MTRDRVDRAQPDPLPDESRGRSDPEPGPILEGEDAGEAGAFLEFHHHDVSGTRGEIDVTDVFFGPPVDPIALRFGVDDCRLG